MAKPLVSDDLWAVVAPLLPPEPPKPQGGRPRVPDRACLTGILFVLKSGIPWEMLPQEMGCGSGMTCWRRLRDWHVHGVWDALHRVLLDRLGEAGQIDWSRASLDCASVPAKKGGDLVGPNPTDRGKPGTKRHILTDRGGLPLAKLLTGANRHESVVFEQMLDAVPPIKQPNGHRRKRPDKLHADKATTSTLSPGADAAPHPRAHRPQRDHSSRRLGRHRWVVERTSPGSASTGG